MILQLILLFSFFHYGRAQWVSVWDPYYPVPFAVRSPYFNRWGFLQADFAGRIQNNSILSMSFPNDYQHQPDWDPSLEARYFLARHNTKTDCTLEL
ncbi:hypothetical protein EDB84DRAFT_1516330 [Lactarius hengduanensis]|nr:hypothetical protein EDB84DRAFT_1516330 [Lactarius hengduanensis]